MYFTITQELWNQLVHYISSLDWTYIFTFILIAYGINSSWVKSRITEATRVRWRTRYRIAITGFLYGGALYFIRGYQMAQIECLLQSFVFALVLHKLILEAVIRFISNRIDPSTPPSGDHTTLTHKSSQNGQM